jgi:hypothetical protein
MAGHASAPGFGATPRRGADHLDRDLEELVDRHDEPAAIVPGSYLVRIVGREYSPGEGRDTTGA